MLWFKSNKAIDEFSAKLAIDLAQRYPPSLETDATKKRNPDRLAKAFDSTFNRAIDFQRERKLGVYGKARLGNTFRWKLKELGYPDEFIEIATKALVHLISVQRTG
jgi:hypothetical protein